ncbi:MAG TPA: porin, partial [Methylomirabilota bacterium]|nr:porin [Methylomirabilota bacterium]
MKKVLLGTSAVALAGAFATSSANAVEWNVVFGGYMEQFAAYADSDVDGISGDFSGIDNKSESEIHFRPSITLDNGIKFGAHIELEGNAGGAPGLGTPDVIDESYLFIDGAFGRFLAGSENSAGYLMTYSAPSVTFITNSVNSGGLPNFVPFGGTVTGTNAAGATTTLGVGNDLFRGTLYSTFIENKGNNDANRFTYFTPRFAGFQLGASYARDANQDTFAQLNLDLLPQSAIHDIFDVGANYVNSFGAIDVAVSGRWGIASDGRARVAGTDIGKNPQVWGAGLNLGFGGFTVGGSFAEQNNADVSDGQSWDAGVAYETGPWGFSFTYLRGENVDNENAALGADETLDAFTLAGRYTLAKGVAATVFGSYVNFDEDIGDGGGA